MALPRYDPERGFYFDDTPLDALRRHREQESLLGQFWQYTKTAGHLVGGVLGLPYAGVSAISRASARNLFGIPVSEEEHPGSMLRAAVGLAPTKDDTVARRLAGGALEFGTSMALEPLIHGMGARGLAGLARAGRVAGAAPGAIRAGRAAEAAQRVLHPAFAATMGLGGIEAGQAALEAARRGEIPEAAELGLHAGLSAGMIAMPRVLGRKRAEKPRPRGGRLAPTEERYAAEAEPKALTEARELAKRNVYESERQAGMTEEEAREASNITEPRVSPEGNIYIPGSRGGEVWQHSEKPVTPEQEQTALRLMEEQIQSGTTDFPKRVEQGDFPNLAVNQWRELLRRGEKEKYAAEEAPTPDIYEAETAERKPPTPETLAAGLLGGVLKRRSQREAALKSVTAKATVAIRKSRKRFEDLQGITQAPRLEDMGSFWAYYSLGEAKKGPLAGKELSARVSLEPRGAYKRPEVPDEFLQTEYARFRSPDGHIITLHPKTFSATDLEIPYEKHVENLLALEAKAREAGYESLDLSAVNLQTGELMTRPSNVRYEIREGKPVPVISDYGAVRPKGSEVPAFPSKPPKPGEPEPWISYAEKAPKAKLSSEQIRDFLQEQLPKKTKLIEKEGVFIIKEPGALDILIDPQKRFIEIKRESYEWGYKRKLTAELAKEGAVAKTLRLSDRVIIDLVEGRADIGTLAHEGRVHAAFALGKVKPREVSALFKKHDTEENVARFVENAIRERSKAEAEGRTIKQPSWVTQIWEALKRLYRVFKPTAESVEKKLVSGEIARRKAPGEVIREERLERYRAEEERYAAPVEKKGILRSRLAKAKRSLRTLEQEYEELEEAYPEGEWKAAHWDRVIPAERLVRRLERQVRDLELPKGTIDASRAVLKASREWGKDLFEGRLPQKAASKVESLQARVEEALTMQDTRKLARLEKRVQHIREFVSEEAKRELRALEEDKLFEEEETPETIEATRKDLESYILPSKEKYAIEKPPSAKEKIPGKAPAEKERPLEVPLYQSWHEQISKIDPKKGEEFKSLYKELEESGKLIRKPMESQEEVESQVSEFIGDKELSEILSDEALRNKIDSAGINLWGQWAKRTRIKMEEAYDRLESARATGGDLDKAEGDFLQEAIDHAAVMEVLTNNETVVARALKMGARVKEQLYGGKTSAETALDKALRSWDLSEEDIAELKAIYAKAPKKLPDALAKKLWKGGKFSASAYASEAYRGSLLTGLPGYGGNMLGNLGNFAAEVNASWAAERLPIKGKGQVRGETWHGLIGVWGGLGPALKKFVRDSLGAPSELLPEKVKSKLPWFRNLPEVSSDIAKFDMRPSGAIPGRLGKAFRLGPTEYGIADNLFSTFGQLFHLHRLAFRAAVKSKGKLTVDEFVQNFGRDLENLDKLEGARRREVLATKKEIEQFGEVLTFRQALGPAGQSFKDWTAKTPGMFIPFPFVKTLLNIAKATVKLSPLGAGQVLYKKNRLTSKQRMSILKKYEKSKLPRSKALAEIKRRESLTPTEKSEILGRSMVGTAFMGVIAGLIKAGLFEVTGSGPTDPDERYALQETGWQPKSFRFGDTYVSFQRFEPVSALIGMLADGIEIMEENPDKGRELVNRSFGLFVDNLQAKNYLLGFDRLADFFSNPGTATETFARRTAPSLLPFSTALGTLARSIDPTLRETKGAGIAESVGKAVKSRIPGLSMTMEPIYSVTGKPVERGGTALTRAVSPAYISKERPERDVERELLRIGLGGLGTPSKTITEEGKQRRMSDREYQVMVEGSRDAARHLQKMMRQPGYQRLPDKEDEGGRRSKEYIVRQLFRRYRTVARNRVYARFRIRRKRRGY